MTKGTINGKEYSLHCTMATAIAYERETGKNFFSIMEELNSGYMEGLIELCKIMFGNDAPNFNDLDYYEFGEFSNLAIQECTRFLSPKKGDPKPTKDSEEEEKN